VLFSIDVYTRPLDAPIFLAKRMNLFAARSD